MPIDPLRLKGVACCCTFLVLFRIASETFPRLFRCLACFSGLDDLTPFPSLQLLTAFQSRVFQIGFCSDRLDEGIWWANRGFLMGLSWFKVLLSVF